jgi:hypothetical protein
MLFEGKDKPQKDELGKNTYISDITPELQGDCENEQAYILEHTHPRSSRTLTAIRLADLATPNLVPPAVPLSPGQVVNKCRGKGTDAT